uniref:VWFD domain-containing protein n=1 Tax=Ciona savignyi TaxID=51511 RepID=H2Z9C0_CIOSA
CPNGMVHSECGSACPRTCKNKDQALFCTRECVDGCVCPSGTILDVDSCVPEEQCSCTHSGAVYASGTMRSEECKECECNGGTWTCTDLPCSGECSATGDPHYLSYDGMSLSFTGDCQYVIVENVKCGLNGGTCTKAATVVIRNSLKETKYRLKQEGVVAVDDDEVTLPYSHGDITIVRLSSMMVELKTSSGMQVDWDGEMRLYVKLDPSWRNKVCGLCGNFNGKAGDDMRTPKNSVETNPLTFANSWKVTSQCAAVPSLPDSCSANEGKIAEANELCDVIKSDVFKACHPVVDYARNYAMCRSDVCGCTSGQSCTCSSLSDYARKCQEKGVTIDWRSNSTCAIQCADGLVYNECGGDCVSKCSTLSGTACSFVCQPGCYCPEGLYLNDDGACVESQECGCVYEGEKYAAGETLDTPAYLCKCADGVMSCQEKQESEICSPPLIYIDCSSKQGTGCQETCQTSQAFCASEKCVPGCGCPEGTIKDENSNECVKPEQCTCTHNGELYNPGATISPDSCNTCHCEGGVWSCTEMACPAECSAIGDPHFTSFDGLKYNFQGDCSYVMSENFCGNQTTGSFRVVVENIPCGSNDVTCTKSVTAYVYNHVIKLTKGDGEPNAPSAPHGFQYNIRKGSIYYILDTNIGLAVLWNKENAVKVQLQPNLMNKVCGLCGNFDGDMSNDLQTRDGDVVANPNDFGNNWKTAESCPDASRDPNPCQESPERAPWAEKKCAVINGEAFAECHSKVDPATYYENCMYDTCGCDFGGDCECFCTAVAAYAQACASAGVCVNWRDNEICPVMCEVYNPGFGSEYNNETCEWKYNACGDPCPPTCDDRSPDCAWKTLEGCYVTCKDEHLVHEQAVCAPCEIPSLKPTPTTTTVAPTTTEQPEESVKPTPTTTTVAPTTTEQPEESGSEAPVTTTTLPVKPTPTTTEQPEESGSGETTVPEAPVTTTTLPVKPTPTTTTVAPTTTEQPEESGSGETTVPEAPVTTTTAPVTTTTLPVKPTPTTTTVAPTTTEQPEESGSGETTVPEAPVTTTTLPLKPTPTTTTAAPTTTEQPEESGSGETTVPEAPVTTTTVPVKPTPTTTTVAPTTTTTMAPTTTTEETGSGETTVPEAPVTTTTLPVKPTPTTTTAAPTTTTEETGSGETTVPEAPVTTTTLPVKPTPTTTTAAPTTTTEETGSGETTVPEAPVTTTTLPSNTTSRSSTTSRPSTTPSSSTTPKPGTTARSITRPRASSSTAPRSSPT